MSELLLILKSFWLYLIKYKNRNPPKQFVTKDNVNNNASTISKEKNNVIKSQSENILLINCRI